MNEEVTQPDPDAEPEPEEDTGSPDEEEGTEVVPTEPEEGNDDTT